MRKPTWRRHVSSSASPDEQRHLERVERLLAVARAATTGPGRRTSSRSTAVPSAPTSTSVRRPATVAATRTGSRPGDALDVDVHLDAAVASGPRVTSGRTAASRAVSHRCRVTGRQMPAVTSSGPQSQPKLQAILRTTLKG